MKFYKGIEMKMQILEKMQLIKFEPISIEILIYPGQNYFKTEIIDMHYKIINGQTILQLNNLEFLQNCDTLQLYMILFGISLITIVIGLNVSNFYLNFTISFQFLVKI